MASLFLKVTQKLKRGLRGISTCVIRGRKEDIYFPESMFEPIMEHAARCPIVSEVPSGRLFPVHSDKPIQIQDHWRNILFSALVQSVNCKENYDSIYDAYNLNNVGVLRDLNIVAFRKFERVGMMTNTNHNEYCSFVKNLLNQLYGPSALEQLEELSGYLSLFQDPLPPDYFLLYNPFFLGEDGIANFYFDSHRLMRHELPLRRQGDSADSILLDLSSVYDNQRCAAKCEKNMLLKHLLGIHAAEHRAISIKRSKWPPRGSTVADVHRHAVVHSIEWSILDKARASTLSSGTLDLLKRYTRGEVIRGMRYDFPLYPHFVALSFEENRLWHMLRMHRRLRVSELYGYAVPK